MCQTFGKLSSFPANFQKLANFEMNNLKLQMLKLGYFENIDFGAV